MGTSIITDICNALDVKINEEFILVSKDGTKRAVKLTHAGLLVCGGNTLSKNLFIDLCLGDCTVIKHLRKPKRDEKYWTYALNLFNDKDWVVSEHFWADSVFDNAVFKAGWVFTSEEAAKSLCHQQHLKQVSGVPIRAPLIILNINWRLKCFVVYQFIINLGNQVSLGVNNSV